MNQSPFKNFDFSSLTNSFGKDEFSAQQAKAQEVAQSISSEIHKQISKTPAKVQEFVDLSTQNFKEAQHCIQQTMQQPQSFLQLWTEQAQNFHKRNTEYFTKQCQENMSSIHEFNENLKKIALDAQEVAKESFTKATTEVQSNIEKTQEAVKSQMEDFQKTATQQVSNVVKQAENFTSQVQEQVKANIKHATDLSKNVSAATQTVKKKG